MESNDSLESCSQQNRTMDLNNSLSWFEFHPRYQTTKTTGDQMAGHTLKTNMTRCHNRASHEPSSSFNDVKVEKLKHCDQFRGRIIVCTI